MRKILARLREPSTWAAIAVLLGVFGIPVPEDFGATVAEAVDKFAAGAAMVAAVAAAVMGEKGKSDA